MIEKIGIVIWGCKRGYHKSLCNNGVVDISRQDISQTLKDVRSTVRINESGIDTYALEFTNDYKIYTQYRSSNDSGTGAFIAVTVYVPHKVKVTGIRTLLGEMMKCYFNEYMNPISCAPLPGKYEDIDPFQAILEQHAESVVDDKSRFRHKPSRQDDYPQIIAYTDIDDVDKYFDSPYRPEFFACQEVMFMADDLVKTPSKHGASFFMTPKVISHVSDPEPETILREYTDNDFNLTLFELNGEDLTEKIKRKPVPLVDEDIITLRIEKEHYQTKDTGKISVRDAVARRLIKRNADNNYSFCPMSLLETEYFVKVVNRDKGVKISELMGHLRLQNNDLQQNYDLEQVKDDCGFRISGPAVEKQMTVNYSIVKNPKNRKSSIDLQTIQPYSLCSTGKPIEVDVVKRRIEAKVDGNKSKEEFDCTLKIKDTSVSFKLQNIKDKAKKELKIPASLPFTDTNVEVTADNYTCVLVNDVLRCTPKDVTVTLVLQDEILNALSKSKRETKIYYCEDGKDDVEITKGEGEYSLRLPYGWEMTLGKVRIDGSMLDVEPRKNNTEMVVRAMLVLNETSDNVQLTYTIKRDSTTSRLDDFALLPYNSEISVDEEHTKKERKSSNQNLRIYEIKANDAHNGSQGGGDKENEYEIVFENCENFSCSSRKTKNPLKIREIEEKEGKRKRSLGSDRIDISNKKEKVICTIYKKDSQKDNTEENKKHGFTVTRVKEGNTTIIKVKYTKKGGLIGRLLKKKIVFPLLSVLVLAAALIIILPGLIGNQQEDVDETEFYIRYVTTDSISEIKSVKALSSYAPFEPVGNNIIRIMRDTTDKRKSLADEKIIVSFKDDISDTITIVSARDRGNLEKKLSERYEREHPDTMDVTISSPGQRAYEALLSKNGPLDKKECEEAANRHKSYNDKIMALLETSENVTEEASQELNTDSLKEEYDKLIKNLEGVFTKNDVKEIREFEKKYENSDELKALFKSKNDKIKQYEAFFNKETDLNDLKTDQFTKEQKDVIDWVLNTGNDVINKRDFEEWVKKYNDDHTKKINFPKRN